MSNRCTTLILPTHNTSTLRVLIAIIASEGKSDDVAKLSDCAACTADALAIGWTTRRESERFSDIIKTSNLHITISPDVVKYKHGGYRAQTIRVQMSAYSCDPYGREAIAAVVDQASTRY